MKNIRRQLAIWIQVGTFLAIWVAILYFSGTELRINWISIKRLPHVVTAYAMLHFIFTKWAWRLRIFQRWLVPLPDLQGTWKGEIRTTWQDPQRGSTPPLIPATLVVRQSFDAVHCALYTEESESQSNAALLTKEAETGAARLSFNYTNRPRASVRDRSAIHSGAAMLRVFNKDPREVRGEYWTDRRTTGEMMFVFKSRKLAEQLE